MHTFDMSTVLNFAGSRIAIGAMRDHKFVVELRSSQHW
jgi:hypothetical protein